VDQVVELSPGIYEGLSSIPSIEKKQVFLIKEKENYKLSPLKSNRVVIPNVA
jgi:hypothetical protein